MIAVCRLNVASDLPWERIDPTLFSAHPSIRFYDYTKGAVRLLGDLPANYTLTYSWNELSSPAAVVSILERGHNVAMIFDTIYQPSQGRVDTLPQSRRLPGTDSRFRVVDGDVSDIRLPELDGRGAIIGLRGKGGRDIVATGVADGFILPTIRGVVRSLAK